MAMDVAIGPNISGGGVPGTGVAKCFIELYVLPLEDDMDEADSD